jgi:lysozyme family protein
MSADTFPIALAFTLDQEGGFSDNPDDPGGATMHGVTLATFQKFVPNATVADLKAIPDFAVSFIYWLDYWREMRCDDLPSGVDLSVWDFGVNAGPARSIEMLQQAVGADVDGDLGPLTLAAVGKMAATDLVTKLNGLQVAYYQSLPTFSEFGAGWLARSERRLKAALAAAVP